MLTTLILKSTIPGIAGELTPAQRNRCGIVAGWTGIISNVFLAVIKVSVAIFTGSIAVAADAVNNLSDAGTGIITVVGFRLSSRPPDAEHPFGHGRTEYVAGLVVALLIIGLGVSFLKDSVMSLIKPHKVEANLIGLTFFSATIAVKLWLFLFYRKIAGLTKSDIIQAAAHDSLSDCLGTGLVIGSLTASRFTTFPVDGCTGIIVAGMVLWAGVSVLKDTVSKLLGEPPDKTLVDKIKTTILSCPGIDGIHDIIIHNYGENSYYVTAHAEISCIGDRFSAHDILENAEVTVAKKLPVHLLLHGDPYNKENPEVISWRGKMENTVSDFDSEFKLYDFRLKKNGNKVEALSFHLLIPHRYGMNEAEIHKELLDKMTAYQQDIQLDITFLKSFI